MNFILTHHAEIRMYERAVSELDILFTLSNFHTSRPGNSDSTGLFAIMKDGSTVSLWIVGELPLKEPVIIKSVGKEAKR